MSYGVGRRCGSDPTWLCLWLWHRPAAVASLQPLAWEFSYVARATLKKAKKEKKERKGKEKKRKDIRV